MEVRGTYTGANSISVEESVATPLEQEINGVDKRMAYEDSTLKAEVSFKEIKYQPKNNLVYYWYKSNEVKKNLGGYSGQLLNGK